MPGLGRRIGFVLAGVGAALGVTTCTLASPRAASDAAALGVAAIGLETALACLAVLGALVSQGSLRERLGLLPVTLPAAALVWLVLGTLALSHALDAAAELTGLRAESALADLDAQLAGVSGARLWLALLGLGLAPGFAEELFCRGLVQRSVQAHLPAWLAVCVGAAVFGALHVEPTHAVFAGVLGLYLGAAAVLARSVLAPMLCHGVNNLTAVAAAAWLPGGTPRGGLSLALGLAVAGVCLALAARGARPENGLPGLQPEAGDDEQ